MNKENFYNLCFIGGILLTPIGAFFKILHIDYLESLLVLGVILSFFYILLSIVEVVRSNRISNNEKTMWVICLIFLNGITGILYYFMGRKRIKN
ncbi:MAG: PLDc N-terminal domain-containing protein [Sphingobacteriia bacterium]|jgi:hypothetical protein